ncbi:MAG: adenosine deaminase [Rhodospirillaceae bacterium]|nr:adenosine deaminase [Rhodospirillaceae bacterium]
MASVVVAWAGAPARAAEVSREAATAAAFEALKQRPAELTAFLRAMPKGGDLHNHLSGAIYAESWIAWAAEDGVCVDLAELVLSKPPCDSVKGRVAVATVLGDELFTDRLIDALSVRNYKIYGRSGHDQFFATFSAFDPAGKGRGVDMLVEVVTGAAEQNISYLELMGSAGMSSARKLAADLAWDDDLKALRGKLADKDIDRIVQEVAGGIDALMAGVRKALECDTKHPPACDVTVRFLAQVIRVFPPEQVFAQVLYGYHLAKVSPHVVGINLVGPEDDRVTLAGYARQMASVAFVGAEVPGVAAALHAGELTMGLVPPKDLRFHVREAVLTAGARRIGHGVDILYEDDPYGLMAEMVERGVMVEILLTSNDVILGVEGKDHPFETYRAMGVPVALSTDDEGVSRIDLTHEFVRAARTYDLDYANMKAFARNSMTYAFIDGDSLWQDPGAAVAVADCAKEALGAEKPGKVCASFLEGSEKARLQWRLERDFAVFEASWPTHRP